MAQVVGDEREHDGVENEQKENGQEKPDKFRDVTIEVATPDVKYIELENINLLHTYFMPNLGLALEHIGEASSTIIVTRVIKNGMP